MVILLMNIILKILLIKVIININIIDDHMGSLRCRLPFLERICMNEIECGMYYHNTGKIPPLTLTTWVSVYNILVNAGFEKI